MTTHKFTPGRWSAHVCSTCHMMESHADHGLRWGRFWRAVKTVAVAVLCLAFLSVITLAAMLGWWG